MANRHLSRSIVLQTLFELDFNKFQDLDVRATVARNIREFALGMEDDAFVYALADQVIKKRAPVEKFGGALVYAREGGNLYLALVHDVFGYWTLSKGHIDSEETEEEGTMKRIKEEIGLPIEIKEKLGDNEYVASHPEKGKILKKVAYFLAESEYRPFHFEPSGGLDEAKWFQIKEVPELRIYNDIIPLIGKAIEIISKQP